MSDAQCSEISLAFNRHIINLLDSLSALSELAALSIHDFDESQLLRHALEALMSNQDMERCSIFLLGEDGLLSNAAGLDWEDMLRGLTDADVCSVPVVRPGTSYRLGEGVMGLAARDGGVIHCPSCSEDPRFEDFGFSDKPVRGALLCVSIRCEDQVLGVLNVFHPQPGFFNLWHERLLLLFCQVLGRLLLNHRFTHHLSTLLDARTREVMQANSILREEAELRREAREQLEYQHAFLQSVLDSAPEPMMVIGLDYRLIMANAPARHCDPESTESVAATCHQLSHHRDTPCEGESHQCPLRMVVARNEPVSVVHEHFNGAGEARLIELWASPLRDRAGAVIGIIESARDITERKHTQLEYQTILETTTDGYLVVDVNGRILDTNAAYCAMSGYRKEELLRMRTADIDAIESPESLKNHTQHLREQGYQRFETRHLRKDARVIDVEVSVTYLAIRGGLLIAFIREITERKQTELRIRQLAFYDSLTNLPNRRLLVDRLDHALAQAKRFQRSLAVMFLDLDHFKQINDTLGHDAGDDLLKQVAGRLNLCVRAGDTVSRLSGDEFVIVLAEVAQPEDAALVAEKIIASLEEPIAVMGRMITVTTSIGITVCPGISSVDIQELMKQADLAMYETKEAGRNGYRFYRGG